MTFGLVKTIQTYRPSPPTAVPLCLNAMKTARPMRLLRRIRSITLDEFAKGKRFSRNVGFNNHRSLDSIAPSPYTIPITIHRYPLHRTSDSAVSSLGA